MSRLRQGTGSVNQVAKYRVYSQKIVRMHLTTKKSDEHRQMFQNTKTPSRRDVIAGMFTSLAVVAAPNYANAAGFLRGAGDIRRIKLTSQRTGEAVDTIYWIEGEYIPEALAEISWFMRDWRQNELIQYDRRNIDILAATLRLMDTEEAYNVVSGYRSPATNRKLSRSNRGVAQNSYHMRGMAADLKLTSRSISQMAKAAVACHAGGVGKYNRSNFVHMDCGPVRTWRG